MSLRALLQLTGVAILALLLPGGAGAAPAQDACLAHGSPTLEEAARRFLEALGAGDADALRRLTLSTEEFRNAIWPWLPASSPRTNLTPEFVWGHYAPRNEVAFRRLLEAHGGVSYRLVAIEPESERDFAGFQLVVRPVLVVEDPAGAQKRLQLFGSVIHQDGRYKVYGFKTD